MCVCDVYTWGFVCLLPEGMQRRTTSCLCLSPTAVNANRCRTVMFSSFDLFFYFRVPLSVTDNKIGRTYISSIRVVHAVLGEESQQELNYSVCGVLCLLL